MNTGYTNKLNKRVTKTQTKSLIHLTLSFKKAENLFPFQFDLNLNLFSANTNLLTSAFYYNRIQ